MTQVANLLSGARVSLLRCEELSFTAYEQGRGPLVLLLHGFPDTPATFSHQLSALAAAGYRAVAVTLRGYEPSSQPASGSYRLRQLAQDVLDWMDALGEAQAHLVGHDWGATIAFAAAKLSPGRVRSLCALAVPQPARFAETLAAEPAQLPLLNYIAAFQATDAEAVVSADGWAYMRRLWKTWSPDWEGSREFEAMLEQFSQPGVVKAALDYYRQAMDTASPDTLQGQALLMPPVLRPTLGLCGDRDGCILPKVFELAMQADDFPAGLRVARLDRAGHFLHVEQPEATNGELLRFLSSVIAGG